MVERLALRAVVGQASRLKKGAERGVYAASRFVSPQVKQFASVCSDGEAA